MQATEMLRNVKLFKSLTDDMISQLESRAVIKRLEEGESYLHQGQHARAWAVVLSGEVKIYRVNRAGKEQVFAFAGPGDVIMMGALTNPNYMCPANSVARAATEIAELDLNLVREFVKRDPQFAMAIISEQSRRILDMQSKVDQLSLKDAHNRLAQWLDEWISKHYPDLGDDEGTVNLPYTQSEIAAQIGTVREVVSRGFSRMEKEGMVRASGKRLTMLSRKRLRHMADQ